MTALVTKHLPMVAGAPDGIRKLRMLIQQLAVQGRLIPKSLSWESLKLADLGKWAVGSGFPTAEQGKKDLPVLFCKVSDMNLVGNERFIRNTNHTIDEEAAKRLRVNIHPAGTVVFPKIGGAISTNKRRILIKPSAVDNNCLGISPRESVSSDYLYLLLTSIDFTVYQAGTSVPALSQGVIGQISVGLPSLLEQHSIVAKVDELMALCDRLEADQADAEAAHAQLVQALLASLTQATDAADFRASWQRLSEHFHTLFTTEASIDALKKSVLELAVMGLLVPPESGKGPWAWTTLAEQVTGMDSGWSPSCDESPSPSDDTWGVLRTTAVQPMRYVQAENKTLPNHLDPRPTAEVKDGDVLFTRAGPMNRVGISCLVDKTRPRLMLSDKIIRFRPKPECLDGRFTVLCLNAGVTARYLEDAKSGMAASQVNISQAKLKAAPIPLPPLAEQHHIVAKVDELMALCDHLKAQLSEARQQHGQLAKVLVEQAVAR